VRLKLDENITVVAQDLLVALGHDADTVADEQLVGRPDPDVLAAAVADQRALVTFDVGFGDPRSYPPDTHRGVILLRLRDQQPDNVVSVLQRLAENHDLDELAGCVVVVTEALIRIRWPD
jgi:predicted nuclease of predicted toxin-antitoxin system